MLLWLAKHGQTTKITWSGVEQEHLFTAAGDVCSYPTLPFIQSRLRLAGGGGDDDDDGDSQDQLAGVSLWELGQVMAAFLSLF